MFHNQSTFHNRSTQRKQAALLVVLMLAAGCQRGEELGPTANLTSAAKIREAFASGAGQSESESSPTKAPASTATGWATIKGRFVYDGTPPTMTPYRVNKDQATCTVNGKVPLQETLLVDSESKGIANIAIYVRKASRVHDSAQSDDANVVFDQKNCVFLSHVFPITLGQTVSLKNSDSVGHNTNISGKNSFNQTIPDNASVDFTPQKEEAVPVTVVCSIHPWMKAYFLPRTNGYVAVSEMDGSFEIANLPAGEELEFQVWHESAAGPGSSLVLKTPEAKELKWSKKGRFKLTLTEDEVKEIELAVPAAAFAG